MFSTESAIAEHSEFMKSTDIKSLYKQLKIYVDVAKDNYERSVIERRLRLGELLESEDKVYEEEFANKVKSRIDEELKKRNAVLFKIKEKSTKQDADLLDRKRIASNIKNCYEIRQAFRRREREFVRICQEEQILEKERAIKKERDADKYWLEVDRINCERAKIQDEEERQLKFKFVEQVKCVLDQQMLEQEEKREELRKEKQMEIERIAKLAEELRVEEFNRKHENRYNKPEVAKYRKELLDSIEERRKQKEQEECERAEDHRKMIAEYKACELEQNENLRKAKFACRKATLEYIDYMRRMRQLEEQQSKLRNDRIEDLEHVEICTKNNIAKIAREKAKAAAVHFEFLRNQMCEQIGRRLREEAERRELYIIDNPFGKSEKTRQQIIKERQQQRKNLDRQLEDLKRIRDEETKTYEKGLMMAADDPVLCAALAEKYIEEGIDFLTPHANWYILGCPQKEFIPKVMPPLSDKLHSHPHFCAGGIPCGCATKPKMTSNMRSKFS